ncbi:hypothetical protein D3C81_1435430 [compost metagenome]
MRTHPTAVGGVADHHVVEPRVGHETELAHQVGRGLVVQVDALHQERPLAGLARREVVLGKRAVLELPAVAKVRHQARLYVLAVGQIKKRFTRHRRHDSGHGLSNQQRFAVPDLAHEHGGCHAPKQRERRVGIDGARRQGLRV